MGFPEDVRLPRLELNDFDVLGRVKKQYSCRTRGCKYFYERIRRDYLVAFLNACVRR